MVINNDFVELLASERMSRKDASSSQLEDQGAEHMCGYRGLWSAVITQALMDAGSNSKKPEMKSAKAKAISWLNGDSEDFTEVCIMAGFEPDYVRKKAREAIANGCKWREEFNPFLRDSREEALQAKAAYKKDLFKKKSGIKERIKNLEYKNMDDFLTIKMLAAS